MKEEEKEGKKELKENLTRWVAFHFSITPNSNSEDEWGT